MGVQALIRVLLAEDHGVVRQGIRRAIEETLDIVVVGEAQDGEEALVMANELKPDVLLCDIRMPVLNGIEVIRRLAQISPQIKSLVLSAFDSDDHISEAIALGASGYLLKTMDVKLIPEAVRRAFQGETVLLPPIAGKLAAILGGKTPSAKSDSLTDRERQVMTLAAQGLSNRAIAQELDMRARTVEGHLHRVFIKLSVTSRLQAVDACLEKHLVDT